MFTMKKLFSVIICVIACLTVSRPALSQSVNAQKDKKARLEREIAIIDKQLAEASSQSLSKLTELELIRKKIDNRKELLGEADALVRHYDDRIYRAQRQINRLQARVDTLSNHYTRLVRSAYKNRDTRLWYMYILSSENLSQAFRRFGYFRNLSSQMNEDARKIKQAQEELQKEKSAMRELKAEAESVRQERAAELQKLKDEEKSVDAVVRQLNKDKKK